MCACTKESELAFALQGEKLQRRSPIYNLQEVAFKVEEMLDEYNIRSCGVATCAHGTVKCSVARGVVKVRLKSGRIISEVSRSAAKVREVPRPTKKCW